MLKVFSYGGGVQSTAALVLAAQGKIDYQTFLFSNVGAESENPATLTYLHKVAIPYAEKHGLEIIELSHPHGTLYQQIMSYQNKGYLIPAFFVTRRGKNPGTVVRAHRQCTSEQKIEVVDKWLKEHGGKEEGAIVGLGISADEVDRVKPNMNKSTMAWKTMAWPLLFDVPRAYTRQDCVNEIEEAGLVVPPRSACVYCPHHPLSYWQDMRTNDPAEFQRWCDFERYISDRQVEEGQPAIYLTRSGKFLGEITTEEFKQPTLFGDMCESGYCMV